MSFRRSRSTAAVWSAVIVLLLTVLSWSVEGGSASYMDAAIPARRQKEVSPPAEETIAVVGTGNMGSAIAELFCKSGIPVYLASRSSRKARSKADALNRQFPRCHVVAAASSEEALSKSTVAIITTPFTAVGPWLRANRDAIIRNPGLVLVDISNVWRSGEGIAANAPVLSGVEMHQAILGGDDVNTPFVAAFKNNFAMKRLQHATGRRIVEFVTDDAAARRRFEALIKATEFEPSFRGKISAGAAAVLEAEAGPFRPDLKAKHAQFAATVRRRGEASEL